LLRQCESKQESKGISDSQSRNTSENKKLTPKPEHSTITIKPKTGSELDEGDYSMAVSSRHQIPEEQQNGELPVASLSTSVVEEFRPSNSKNASIVFSVSHCL